MASGPVYEGNRARRRADEARRRQAEKHARRPVMTQRHPQQLPPKQETLREGLTDAQIEVMARGIMLLRKICTGTDIDLTNARVYADQTIDLLDAFAAAADKDNI